MGPKATILFLIPHLGGGGAQKVITHLVSKVDRQKYRVHLCLTSESTTYCFPSDVTVHCLHARRVRWSAWGLLRLVYAVRPDLMVSGMAHLSWMILLLRPLLPRGSRVVARQNGTIRSDHSLAARVLYRWVYSKADAVVCQTSAMAEEVRAVTRSGARTRVLANLVDIAALTHGKDGPSPWIGPGPHLLAVGRLVPEKGFDILLRALCLVRQRHAEADLTILGAGPERRTLEEQAAALGIASCVHFGGWTDRPGEWFSGATMFVLSSRQDALPNALLEAAAAGLPIVTTPASAGLHQLVKDQPGVWSARDDSVSEMAFALLEALRALATGQRFQHTWVEPFRMENALREWEQFIDEMLAGGAR